MKISDDMITNTYFNTTDIKWNFKFVINMTKGKN